VTLGFALLNKGVLQFPAFPMTDNKEVEGLFFK
jgi:hypothetical protein